MTGKDILVRWLRDNGYDGLTNKDCCCTVDDLAPCDCGNVTGCMPAKKCDQDCEHCDTDLKDMCEEEEWDFLMFPDKEEVDEPGRPDSKTNKDEKNGGR